MEKKQTKYLITFYKSLFCLISIIFNINVLKAQTHSIILGRPTDVSITASILFDYNVDCYLEYGTSSGIYTQIIPKFNNSANIPDEVNIQNLKSNTKYFYLMQYRSVGVGSFISTPEYSFQTQRALGSTFTFTVEADEHLYDATQGSPNLYKINLENQKKDKGDFMISLGDIFGDDHTPLTTTSLQMKAKHLFYRQFLGNICHSDPFFICLGNHEGENDYFLNQTPPNNIATYATLWRKYYYPNPFPNSFYSGDTIHEAYGMEQPQNYYSWTWGDALFVVLDVYRDQCDTSANPKKWNWTLGYPQYQWLTNVLQNSTSTYKFVFAHHPNGQQRGGINCAQLYEWGGNDSTGGVFGYHFNTRRPGWAKPIHKLMVDNGVNIVFQGHDHLFAKEILDGVVYQEVPMAADSTYKSGITDWGGYYKQNVLNGSGHLRVTVSNLCVNVDYVEAFLPADTLGVNKNRAVPFSYQIGKGCNSSGISNLIKYDELGIFPNPTKNTITIKVPQELKDYEIRITNSLGETIIQTKSNVIDVSRVPQGIYFVKINSGNKVITGKFVID